MKQNDLGKSPAFPMFGQIQDHDGTLTANWAGMDLRTYIATKCLAGMLSDNKNFVSAEQSADENETHADFFSKNAVKYADALIAELSKNT